MLALVVLLASACGALKKYEAGGLVFPQKHKLGTLHSLGVRRYGFLPLRRAYAVGMYEDANKEKGFLLKFKRGVSGKKLRKKFVRVMRPRYEDDDASPVDRFADLVAASLPNGTKKHTVVAIGTSGGSLNLSVDGQAKGSVASPALALAFREVYLDKNRVCTLHQVNRK